MRYTDLSNLRSLASCVMRGLNGDYSFAEVINVLGSAFKVHDFRSMPPSAYSGILIAAE